MVLYENQFLVILLEQSFYKFKETLKREKNKEEEDKEEEEQKKEDEEGVGVLI